MFLGNISVANTVANQNIPINTRITTNRKIVNNKTSNVLELRQAGIYNIDGWVTVTGTAGTGTIDLYADDEYRDAISFTIPADNDEVTVPIIDAVRANIAKYPQTANISIRCNTGGLSLEGVLRVEYLQ